MSSIPYRRHGLSILSLLSVISLAGCGAEPDLTASEPRSTAPAEWAAWPRAALERSAAEVETPSQSRLSEQALRVRDEARLVTSRGMAVDLTGVTASAPTAERALAALAACQPNAWAVQPQVAPGRILAGVAYGDGLYVAVGDSGEILTSGNGTAWSDLSTASSPFSYLDVAYGNGTFVAVGTEGRISLLSGPVTGTVSFGSGFVLGHVAYGNGAWVVTGAYLDASFHWYSLIIASTDGGLSWNVVSSIPASGATTAGRGVAFGNGVFVVTGQEGDVYSSSNGTTWSYAAYVPGAAFKFVASGGGQFVAGTSNGRLYKSTTGQSWSLDATPSTLAWFSGAYLDGVWVVVGQGGQIASSAGSGSWVSRSSGTSNSLEDVTAGPAAWVSVGTSNPGNQRIVTSSCPLPDLAPFTPSGWSAPIVVSNQPGTSTNSAVITTAQSVYIDLAWANFGNADAGPFTVLLTLQGSSLVTASSTGLLSLSGQGVTDIQLNPLPAGTYTLTVRVDDGNAVQESNEANNSYTRTFTVSP